MRYFGNALPALLVLLVLALACGAAEDPAAESTPQGEDAREPSMAESSPLTAFFIDDGGLQATMMNYMVLIEEEVHLCMAADGFEYIRQDRSVPESVEAATNLTPREWASEYGYGIATEISSFNPRESEDPNTPLLVQLSGSERDLWITALMGGQPEPGPSGVDQRPLEDQGCVGQAFINTGGQGAFEGIQTIATSLEDLETALAEQREVVAVIDEWSRCLSERGYPNFGRLDEPEEYAQDQLDEFAVSVFAALPEITDEERAAWFRGEWGGEEPDFGAAGLPDLQEDEIALALADLDCYEAHVQAVYEPLRDALEYGLLDDYGDEFASLKDLGS